MLVFSILQGPPLRKASSSPSTPSPLTRSSLRWSRPSHLWQLSTAATELNRHTLLLQLLQEQHRCWSGNATTQQQHHGNNKATTAITTTSSNRWVSNSDNPLHDNADASSGPHRPWRPRWPSWSLSSHSWPSALRPSRVRSSPTRSTSRSRRIKIILILASWPTRLPDEMDSTIWDQWVTFFRI